MSDPRKQPLVGGTMMAPSSTPIPMAPGTPVPAMTPVPGSTPVPGHDRAPQIGSSDPLVGTVLADRYRILKKLGEGGMGSVYLAEHTTISKRLAIKVLAPEYTHKQDLVDRFLQEARAASMIEQENVVEITDYGSTPSGSVFFVMEYLQGEDLSHTIRREGPLPWARCKPIILQICEALSAAHASGIIHRDMKPENCYRLRRGGKDDFIKVLDFGIAKVQSDEGDGGRALTRTGMIFGTPEYMSPEQAKGERVDHRVDVYAVGVILYELLTGRVPFTADTFMGILTKHMFEAPPAPSTVVPHADIPPEVEAIILKALQKDREYRFANMQAMAAAIEAVGTGSAAVSVVSEQVAIPVTGEIRYSTSSRSVTVDELIDGRPKSSKRGIVAAVLGGVVLFGAGAFALGFFEGEQVAPPVPAAVADVKPPEPLEVAEVEPTPPVEPPEPAVTTVQVTISTPGIDGYVYDGRDEGRLGKTNEPFSVNRSSDSLDLYVRAEGYEEYLVPVVPDQDKHLTVTPAKLAPADNGGAPTKKRGKGKDKGKKGDPDPKATTATADPKPAEIEPKPKPPEVDPKKDPKKDVKKPDPKGTTSSSPDLKDPFRRN